MNMTGDTVTLCLVPRVVKTSHPVPNSLALTSQVMLIISHRQFFSVFGHRDTDTSSLTDTWTYTAETTAAL